MSTTTTNLGLTKPDVNSVTDADQWGGYLNTDLDLVDSQFVTRTLAYNFADFQLNRPYFKDVAETVNAIGNVSGALNINYENANIQTATAIGNITSVSISNWPASGRCGYLQLRLSQDGTGGRTIALSSAYRTRDNANITLSAGPGALDTIYFETIDGGTTILTTASYNWS